MPDPAPAALAAPPAPAPAPWHAGIESDTLGWWQNKGLPLDDPKTFAAKLTEQYRQLEKHIGAPPDRLIRLPERADDTAGWNAVWERLGAPKEAKDYDFSAIKRADGNPPEPGLIEAIRQAAAAVHAPKERAAEIATAVVKHLDAVQANQAVAAKVALDAEKSALMNNWSPKDFNFNLEIAKKGAAYIGIPPEAVERLENTIGYAKTMEAFRRIGAETLEDKLIQGSGSGNVTTADGAKARLDELLADEEWGKRVTKGDATAVQEFTNLTTRIANAT